MFWRLSLLTAVSFLVTCDSEPQPRRELERQVEEIIGYDSAQVVPDVCDAVPQNSPVADWEYFSGRVVPLVKAGEDVEALRHLDCLSWQFQGLTRIQYLRGRLLEKLDRSRAAAELFDFDDPILPQNVAYETGVRRAALLARTGRCRQARPALKKLGARSGFGRERARIVAAECALTLGENRAAIRELRQLSRENKRHWRLRLQLATALAKSGRKGAAKQTLRALLIEMPNHSLLRRIKKKLIALGGDPELTAAESLERAERLLESRQYSAVIDVLEALAPPTTREEEAQRLHLEGMVLYQKRGHYLEAAEVLKKASKLNGKRRASDTFHAARALSRANRDNEAIAVYRQLVKTHPNHPRGVEAEYRAAWLDLRHGRARGELRMRKFLKNPRARLVPELRREARWHVGFRAFERRRYGEAVKFFREYAGESQDVMVLGRGLYWQGRSWEAMRRRKKAVEIYQEVMGVEALHWYSLLAQQRLNALGGAVPSSHFNDSAEGTGLERALMSDVAFYASIGLEDDALKVLRFRKSKPQKEQSLKALISAYQDLGILEKAYSLASARDEVFRVLPTSESLWIWETAYPRPYRNIVAQAAHENGMEPAHVFATMRQESGFVSSARSRAGALGLLQVLPGTARKHARRLNTEFQRKMLFDPDWNVRLGTAEMAALYRSLGKNLPLTIAAYNAGVGRVRGWLEETGEIELDRFVEKIPFKETQNYVRRVFTHYARYRYLEAPAEFEGIKMPPFVRNPSQKTSSKL